MRKVHLLLASFALVIFAGCAAKEKPMYYWGDYSHTLYELKKHPGDESRSKHVECLAEIIKNSKENGVRVPPGVYAEYGYRMLYLGKKGEAINYFRLEEQTYPESAVLMDRLIESVGKD